MTTWTVNRSRPVCVSTGMKKLRCLVTRLPPLLAAAALTLAGCSSGTAVTTPTGAEGAAASGPASSAGAASAAGTSSAAANFTIKAYVFPPFTATAGQKITIVDSDGEPHTVTADDGSFDSGSFDAAAPGTLTVPTKPGVYPVHCTVHPTMHGTLTVK